MEMHKCHSKIENGVLIKFSNKDLNEDGSYTVPSFVAKINKNAFESCEGLKSIVIHKNVQEIGECAFMNCSALKSVKLECETTSIPNLCFWGCSNLKDVELSDKITN